MGKLVFSMMQSLDGYVAGIDGGVPQVMRPGDQLSRHMNDQVRRWAGHICGRRMYEVMSYWDEDQPDWGAEERDFAAVWRSKPKWVVSRTLKSVGPNATLVREDAGVFVRALKAKFDGEITISGPALAGSATALGLIDEYHLYFRPFVFGGGKPYFAGPRPPLFLVSADTIGGDAVRVIYAA
ncbi:MAG TPA: dihydrofolate reductase family protein [Gemmatimonadales bacterium]|nr:dihydrofolate reductase family protein [Gemmatimonadales bacterium]